MKRLRPITLIFAFLVMAIFIFGPGILQSEQAQNRFYEWLEGEKPQWTGILDLWHIVEWKTGGSSGVAYLKERATAFERNMPGVFIEVHGMTAQEAQQRLESGETPDLISYPTGFSPPMEMTALSMPEGVREDLAESASADGAAAAIPYMYGGYMLLANRMLFLQQGMDLPLDGVWDAALLSETITALADVSQDNEQTIYGLAIEKETWTLPQNAMLLFADGRIVNDKAVLLTEGGVDAFLSGNAALLVSGPGGYKTVRESAAEEGIAYQVYPLSDYTDMVQYVGVCAADSTGKAAVGGQFCDFLLSEASQKKLAELGVFSALDMEIHDGELFEVETAVLSPRTAPSDGWGQIFEEISQLCEESLWDEEAAAGALEILGKTLSH
jgi:hypothetical protein